jgi:hypothetical protein
MSESPDVSSGKSSPDIYDWWQPCTDINNELFYCLANNVDSSMNFKSDDVFLKMQPMKYMYQK